VLAGLESVAIANAVEDKQQDLAVDDELSLRTLKRGLDNPQKAPGVVDAAPRHEPHAIGKAAASVQQDENHQHNT